MPELIEDDDDNGLYHNMPTLVNDTMVHNIILGATVPASSPSPTINLVRVAQDHTDYPLTSITFSERLVQPFFRVCGSFRESVTQQHFSNESIIT